MAGTMYHHLYTYLLCVVLFAASASSQTITTTDALGESIVEVITLDPLLGLPTTQILETLTSSLAITSSSNPLLVSTSSTLTPVIVSTSSTPTPAIVSLPTTQQLPQGPVGAPPASTAAGPTIYTYTTTNADGGTIGVVDTFTPIFAPSTPYTPVSTGTILPYSQWLSSVGGTSAAAAAADQLNSGTLSLKFGMSWLFSTTGFLVGIVTGAWVVLA